MRQAVAHTGMPLGDAIAHANSVELYWLPTGLEHALLNLGSKLSEWLVAGADLIPAVCDRNERLIGVLQRVNRNSCRRKVRL